MYSTRSLSLLTWISVQLASFWNSWFSFGLEWVGHRAECVFVTPLLHFQHRAHVSLTCLSNNCPCQHLGQRFCAIHLLRLACVRVSASSSWIFVDSLSRDRTHARRFMSLLLGLLRRVTQLWRSWGLRLKFKHTLLQGRQARNRERFRS